VRQHDNGSAYPHGLNLIFIGPLKQYFLTGPLAGTFMGTEQDNVIGRNGSVEFHGSGTFVGAVSGEQGSYAFNYQGTVPAGPNSDDWLFSASFVIVGKSDTGTSSPLKGRSSGIAAPPQPTTAIKLGVRTITAPTKSR
jgi:hypothetical protein